jgi:hypothetical protein
MSKYEARITSQGDRFYALIVRIDRDGEENVINGFSRFYKTRRAAEYKTFQYINRNFA